MNKSIASKLAPTGIMQSLQEQPVNARLLAKRALRQRDFQGRA
ncbi:hypothetical protein U724_00715 [Pseudomonas chlororaphis subsp. aurantiaca PB-St2]|nr:hypothetical protein U724_00715 [Pseudomonas chlororaphis subsp. aurantiaca PB-St2]